MRLLATLTFLFSAQAFACPQLTGNFSCTYSDGSTETVAISQSADKTGIVTYIYNGSEIPADNVTYDIADDQNLKGGKFRAWCDDDVTVKSEMTGKYWSNGSYYGDLAMNMNLEMDGANLKQVTTGTLTNSSGAQPIDSTLICTPSL